MAELCGLLQDLGERIAFKNVAASSSSTPSSSSQSQPDLDPLETRFRSVLPTLLRSYVSPSSPGKEREIIAILKLLTHTARNYPGVFYNGKPSHTLPIIGRILPFFAEPAFSCHHGVIFETASSLLSLLRCGDREVFRQFFLDAILAIEGTNVLIGHQDLKSVASFYAEKTSFTASSTVSVKCFSESFSAISGATDLFCELPPSCKSADGPGILVNVTDEPRWQPFASCVIKIITRCLIDGTLHVEGLIGSSFMFNACSLICYGDAALQMALFDFARIATTILDAEIVPSEELILSILSILSPAEAAWSKFRNLQYDSCVGACLLPLYSGCPTEVVQSTAEYLVDVFPQVLQHTESQDLRVAICNAYMCVVNVCPPHIWKPECLITLLCSPKPCLLLVDCILKAIDVLGIYGIEGEALDDGTSISGDSTCKELHISSTGNKRMVQIAESLKRKRRKMHVEANATGHNVNKEAPTSLVVVENFLENSLPFRCKLDEELYADHFQHLLVDFVELLTPGVTMSEFTSPQTALAALSMLSNVFCHYPVTNLSIRLFQQVHAWIPFIAEQAAKEKLIKFDLSLYLEAVDNILILQSCMRKQNPSNDGPGAGRHLALENLFNNMDMSSILVLPWTHSFSDGQVHFIQRTKCLSVQIMYKIGNKMGTDDILKILDMALGDESEDVRIEAIVSVPLMLFFSGPSVAAYTYEKMESLAQDKCEQVKEMVVRCIGYLSCLLGCFEHVHGIKSDCKLYMEVGKMKCVNTAEVIMKGFWCPICDKEAKKPKEEASKATVLFHAAREKSVLVFDFNGLHGLILKFLLDGSSEVVQVACAEVLSRILMHVSEDWLVSTSSQWIHAIDRLLLHNKRTVRQSFCSSIHWFLDGRLSNSLFVDGAACGKTSEQMFLDKIKHAFVATEDPLIVETILQCTSRILSAVDIHGQLFFFSLVLLIDQLDNQHIAVRVTASRLIKKSCHVQFKGGIVAIFSKFTDIRDGVFEYLCTRLVTRPTMIKEFAESVLGIELVDLIQRMVPIVLPRLVISQQDNNEVVNILHELANQLNTELPLLLLEWCHKVLAYVLLQADGKELVSALQFYENQSGSGTGEIFAAVLPALLDELVRFLGDTDSAESSRRMARVPQMVQEVARIVTGSDDLPGFLRNHFVGLLNSIDRKMLRVEDFMLQKQALKCIGKLIEMIGTHLGTYVPKIIVLLMHAVEKESLQNESLEVWHFFITQLSKVSPSSLKHVASQVFAALIPCLERYKENPSLHLDKVVNIFEELVVENKILLAHNIRELPLLPSIPMLAKVNKVIEEARGSMSLRDHLRHAVDGLNHESLNVRYMVACELSKFLGAKGKDVIDLILGESSADLDILSSLITSLLKGCAEESRTHVGQRLKLVSADCLGAVGAVDPAKFKAASCPRFKIECSDDDLIFELIHEHLTRVFRAASDTIVQDSAALAIQELLKLAGCQASLDGSDLSSTSQHSKGRESQENSVKGTSIANHEINERGKRLWARFSNYVKEIIAPCLTSKFQLQSVTESVVAGPIYRPSMSLRRWIYSWIRKLMLQANGSRANIFSACRGIVRHDMETAFYLLPYLVLNALCHGTAEACQGITEEILSVLNAAASESSGAAVHGTAGGQREVCIQAIFTLLDNLGQWVDDLKQEITLSQSTRQLPKTTSHQMTEPAPHIGQLNIQFNNVSELLVAIPKVTLAKASFRCQAYARSLLYFESHVREKSGSFNPAAETSGLFADDDISFLMEIYSGLDEPDGLFGLANLRKSSGLYDQLLINEKIGNWAEALTCCEQALQTEPNSAPRHSGVLNCLLNMCHLQAMITYVDGLISRLHQHKKTWFMQGVQAAWRLGRWDLMDEYLAGADKEGAICSGPVSNASFDMGIAKILQAMMRKDQYLVCERIAQSKQALLAPLAAAGMESYTRAYPFIVKLHMLRELEDFHNLLNGDSFLERSFSLDCPQFLKLVKEWEDRLHYTQPSLWAREPLLALRRMVYSVSNLGAEVGICWLRYAKLCRSAGHYETASRAILEAQSSGAPNVHIEKSKLFWSTRKTDRAIAELQQALLNMPIEILGAAASSSIANFSLLPPNLPSISSTQPSKESEDAAKTILLYTRWIHCTGQKQKEDVISLYSRVRELQPKWEKGYFFMAKYCDDLLVDAKKRQEENQEALKDGHSGSRIIVSSSGGGILHSKTDEKPWWSYLSDVLLFYAKGLHRGHKHLFQALPRLLTLWFEFGSKYHREGLSSNKEVKNVHGRVMSIMRGCLKDLPTYQWLTALSQLVSRICHQNEEVVRLVKHIITTVLQEYPQQALWIMAGVSKSTISARREAAAEILRSARKGSRHGSNQDKLFIEFASLIDHLIKLCFHGGHPKARMINIGSDFATLKRMMPVAVIMPVQQALTVNLPVHGLSRSELHGRDLFSADLATISGIADEAEILSSLQKPKKVIFRGSDGVDYPFLCKPKDDLRKDARMMEFTAMINHLLSKYPESRRRKLYMRTFAVIPLTEDCGMVEWVPHTRGLRHILQDLYVACGKFDRQRTNPMIKKIYDQFRGKMPGDEMLKTKILPLFPPIFHKWFLVTFSEPGAWFRARIAYAHTAAVWSMVGHIVGLGDRHGENILFDSTTGDCVHVDFSCLFDKGLLLEKPELVPFRLTQNMVDGLGITGYEGIFLKTCEITLSVLRSHRETLMSVLETFIHDPLVEWTKSHKSSVVEVDNPHAQKAMSNIEGRLQGVVVGVGAAPSLPLAVEGQAQRLIAEAVSHKNLGEMYIWWMPWF